MISNVYTYWFPLFYLSSINFFLYYRVVDQQTNWLEGCLKCCGVCCADFENTYHVYKDKDKKPTYVIKEDSACLNRMVSSYI